MNEVLEIQFSGWTATPRMPFILSGNAVCLPVPTYSLLLGLVGCCLGRTIEPNEVQIGFHYTFETVGNDLETRQRLEYDGKKVKKHSKGSDAYPREFHINPSLTVWIDRLDWEYYFQGPKGTPALGRSQDILKIESVRKIRVKNETEISVSGTMLPFDPSMQIAGQLVQLADAYLENDVVGSGRIATKTKIFIAVPNDSKGKVSMPNLYSTIGEDPQSFYLHSFM